MGCGGVGACLAQSQQEPDQGVNGWCGRFGWGVGAWEHVWPSHSKNLIKV